MANDGGDPLTKTFKIAFLGEPAVGKSSLLRRWGTGEFRERYQETIGVDIVRKIVVLDGKSYKLNMWDPSGQENFRNAVVNFLYRKVHAVVFVYDMTRQCTLDNVVLWMEQCRIKGIDLDSVPVILLGNKCDLKDEIEVSEADGRQFAKTHGNMMFYQTSAKLDSEVHHVDEILKALVHKVRDLNPPSSVDAYENDTVKLTDKEPEKSACCC